jgi:pimeloyl-ACP methyl ester carboxylesterase
MTSKAGLSATAAPGNKSLPVRRNVQTASGRISYVEQGTGPVALFVHGVLLNSHLWRHQLADLSDIRRAIAVDLLAHGDTEIAPNQDVSVTANAKMLKEFLDALNIDQVDLVGNDSGGGISQIFAARYPERVRSLTLTDCDTHDNWPPEAFKPFLAMAASGGLRGTLDAMLADKSVYRSPQALGPAYEHPEQLSDDSIETYLRPFVKNPQRTHDLERFLAAFDNKHTLAIESQLRTLNPGHPAPCRIEGCQNLFPGRTLGRIRQGAACTLVASGRTSIAKGPVSESLECSRQIAAARNRARAAGVLCGPVIPDRRQSQ